MQRDEERSDILQHGDFRLKRIELNVLCVMCYVTGSLTNNSFHRETFNVMKKEVMLSNMTNLV